MNAVNAMNTSLPKDFEMLEPLVADWALQTQDARRARRKASSRGELQYFYDNMLPRMPAILKYRIVIRWVNCRSTCRVCLRCRCRWPRWRLTSSCTAAVRACPTPSRSRASWPSTDSPCCRRPPGIHFATTCRRLWPAAASSRHDIARHDIRDPFTAPAQAGSHRGHTPARWRVRTRGRPSQRSRHPGPTVS